MEIINTAFNNRSASYYLKPSANPIITVIFIHGFPFDKTTWKGQLEALPDTVQGIAYDIRGFGESTSDHSFYSIDLFARDLLALIDSLSIDNCVLCGISMGGYIALRAAELSQEKLKGLILSDTNCVADINESKLKRFNSIQQILAGGKNEFTNAFIQNVFSEETQKHKPEVVQFLKEIILNTADETICATQLGLASRTDTSELLHKIALPTLIIRGENDNLMPEEQAKQLAEGIPLSEMVNIPDAGHLPNLEDATAFNNCLNTFLHKHFLV